MLWDPNFSLMTIRRSATTGLALAGLAAPAALAQEPPPTPSASSSPEITLPTGPSGPTGSPSATPTPIENSQWPTPDPTVAPAEQRGEEARERARRKHARDPSVRVREPRA